MASDGYKNFLKNLKDQLIKVSDECNKIDVIYKRDAPTDLQDDLRKKEKQIQQKEDADKTYTGKLKNLFTEVPGNLEKVGSAGAKLIGATIAAPLILGVGAAAAGVGAGVGAGGLAINLAGAITIMAASAPALALATPIAAVAGTGVLASGLSGAASGAASGTGSGFKKGIKRGINFITRRKSSGGGKKTKKQKNKKSQKNKKKRTKRTKKYKKYKKFI
jgi:hypothetical protein